MVGPNFRVGKKIGCGNFGELRLGEPSCLSVVCVSVCPSSCLSVCGPLICTFNGLSDLLVKRSFPQALLCVFQLVHMYV